MITLVIWLTLALSFLVPFVFQQTPKTELRAVACAINISNGSSSSVLSLRCAHYYVGDVSWNGAYSYCHTQGYILASAIGLRRLVGDLSGQSDDPDELPVFNSTWIRSNLVYHYQSSRNSGFESEHWSYKNYWFVNAQYVWDNSHCTGQPNGILLCELDRRGFGVGAASQTSSSTYERRCVALLLGRRIRRPQINIIPCTESDMFFNKYFACESDETTQNSSLGCPSSWTTAKLDINGTIVLIEKCYKQLPERYTINNMTWEGARAACIREGGDLFGVDNNLEGVWLKQYASELRASRGIPSDAEFWLYVNLHKTRYCSNATGAGGRQVDTEWCWKSGLAQNVLASPQWAFGEPNEGLDTRDEYCAAYSEKAMGLVDVDCSGHYSFSENYHSVVVCELTTTHTVRRPKPQRHNKLSPTGAISMTSTPANDSSANDSIYSHNISCSQDWVTGTSSDPLRIPLIASLVVALISCAFGFSACIYTCIHTATSIKSRAALQHIVETFNATLLSSNQIGAVNTAYEALHSAKAYELADYDTLRSNAPQPTHETWTSHIQVLNPSHIYDKLPDSATENNISPADDSVDRVGSSKINKQN